jgi:hypothetical protein
MINMSRIKSIVKREGEATDQGPALPSLIGSIETFQGCPGAQHQDNIAAFNTVNEMSRKV